MEDRDLPLYQEEQKQFANFMLVRFIRFNKFILENSQDMQELLPSHHLQAVVILIEDLV